MTDDPAPRRALAARTGPALAATVGLAVVVAAVGLAARPKLHLPRHTGTDPHEARDFALAIITMVLGIVILAIGHRIKVGYRRLTYRLVGLIVFVVPALVVNVNRLVDSARARATPTPTDPTATASGPPAGGAYTQQYGGVPKLSPTEGYAIISLIATVAIVVLLGWFGYRMLRRDGRHVGALALAERASDRDDVLRRASEALELDTAPRGRVIAAYEAMESALRRRGAVRTAEQAPLEWLAGLADVQDAAIEPARELTTIFERARFSSAPVTEEHAEQARQLLDQLRARLSSRASAPAGRSDTTGDDA